MRRSGLGPALSLLAAVGCSASPSFMTPATDQARDIAVLGWWLTGTALLVVALVTGILIAALRRTRRPPGAERPERGAAAIRIGIAVTVAILIAAFLGTLVTLERNARPPGPAGLTVLVEGHQWWWEVAYLDRNLSPEIVTANEIHVPTGVPIRIRLRSADVIHSFWLPQLAGKTDLVPGQDNETWLEVDRPGLYRGQCAEYCGAQHAGMGLVVIAQSPEDFAAWRERERRPAPEPADSAAGRGRSVFETHCAICHTIRGTPSRGRLGPNLTHVASRRTLAAGTLPNTRGNLGGWIANPDRIKPGTLMPRTKLSSEDLLRLLTYLETLR